ncbi:MAG: oligosaccharide flippase family protein [Microcoleaceae cyanobacterium MO_207.B10]|nr:oligosaccharide flippase family protein [Microcoleaceae cyanobacterium MO_207.B10]
MSSLKKRAISGTIWTIVGYGSSQFLRLVNNLILTRLLVPEYFGLIGLVNVFIIGLNLFSDVGIGANIIQNKRGDDPDFYNTAWSIQIIRGFGLWFFCLIMAWPVSNFYEEKQLLWLLPVVGFSTVLNGFSSTALQTLNRHLDVGKKIRFELGTQLPGIIVMIIWALISPSVWSIVGGTLIGNLIKTISSHRLIPEVRNKFKWDRESAKEIFSFGKWIFVSTAITFLANQADRMILGKLFTFEMLGIYTVALTFADLPKSIALRVGGQVLFPLISHYTHLERSVLRAKIIKQRKLLLIGLALFVTFFSCFGDFMIKTLYDDRYSQAAWMMPILALGIWPVILETTAGRTLLAIGKPLYTAFGTFLKFIYMVVLLPLVNSQNADANMAILAAIIVIAFNDIPLYGGVNYGLSREGFSCILQDIQMTLLLIGLIALVLSFRYTLGWGLPIDGIL